MGKSPCCDQRAKLKKGPWSPAEDQKLLAFIQNHGHGRWSTLAAKAGLQRCGKSCRLRWINYLRPDIKRGKFSLREEQTIIQLHALLGNRWSAIANFLPKRTDNEIKNYWNTYVKKRLIKMGIDPVTHQPKRAHHRAFAPGSCPAKDAAHLNHMVQWESARLEAEVRLVRESKKLVNSIPYNQADEIMNKATAAAAPTLPYIDVFKAWKAARSSKPIIPDNSYSIDLGVNIMMATDESARESATSNSNIPETYNLQPMNAKSFPEFKEELDDTMVLQDVGVGNTINAWFAEAGLTGASGGVSDANNVNLPASCSNMMDGFESSQDIFDNGGSGGDGGCVRSGDNVENQNWIYWNNIINLVDTSGSPVI